MPGKFGLRILLLLATWLTLASIVYPQDAPNTIVYQGRLADTSGAPITTSVSVGFAVYNATSEGTALWSATKSFTPDANGIFTVELGPFGDTVFTGDKLYMGIKVGTDPEMMPRQVLTSAPYSFQSLTLADGSVTTLALAPDAVTGAKVLDGTLMAVDIANEPGMAREIGAGGIEIDSAGITNINAASIVVPGAGYVVALAFGYGQILSDDSGLCGSLLVGLETSDTTPPTQPVAWGSGEEDIGINVFRWSSIAVEQTFGVFSSGEYSYYLNAKRGWPKGTAYFFNSKIILLYFPTAYGAVSSIISSGDASEFEKAVPANIEPSLADPKNTTTMKYKVDLRELEIRALKAQLEAVKAQRQLEAARERHNPDSQLKDY